MVGTLRLLLIFLLNSFKSRKRLEAENLVLRHQLNVVLRKSPGRPRLTGWDRALFVRLYRSCPDILSALALMKPDTVIRWHRKGFKAYWRWKSKNRGGRPIIDRELRDLIRRMCSENPLWGAPRIHGELLKLGFNVAQSTVSKYMVRRSRPPFQTWKTFLRNHADGIASADMLVVPTITFKLLYAVVILGHGRRVLLWTGVTDHPTAEWLAQQITEAFPWEEAPAYFIRDRDGAYGKVFRKRLGVMGIRDRPTAPHSSQQNAYVERVIGSIRRECLDHLVVFNEAHLRRILREYATYYNEWRTHWSLGKGVPG